MKALGGKWLGFMPRAGRWGRGAAPVARCVIGGLIVVACMAPIAMGVAAAAAPTALVSLAAATPAALRFPAGSRVEPLADRFWWRGLPLQAVVFDAPVDVPALIRTLSRQQPAFRDLLILPGLAILSGRVGDEIWVAQLASPSTGRSVGSVSSLQAWEPLPQARLPVWVPPAARLVLDIAMEDSGTRVCERVWQHPLAPAQLGPIVRQRLLRQGWHDDGEPAKVGAWQSWRRHDEHLQWMMTPLDAGSGLWVRRWAP